MKKAEVVSFFGNQTKVAKALGITHVAVSKWGDDIPQLRAYQIERITKGALKAEPCSQPAAA